jgi:hypothetical protein
MTRALAFTQASLRRAMKAAEKEGLRVVVMRDGTMTFVPMNDVDKLAVMPSPGLDAGAPAPSKWEDVEA